MNLLPCECWMAVLMWQEELDRGDSTTVAPAGIYGTLDEILDFICSAHWPAPYNAYVLLFQQARFRGLVNNVLKKMVKSSTRLCAHEELFNACRSTVIYENWWMMSSTWWMIIVKHSKHIVLTRSLRIYIYIYIDNGERWLIILMNLNDG